MCRTLDCEQLRWRAAFHRRQKCTRDYKSFISLWHHLSSRFLPSRWRVLLIHLQMWPTPCQSSLTGLRGEPVSRHSSQRSFSTDGLHWYFGYPELLDWVLVLILLCIKLRHGLSARWTEAWFRCGESTGSLISGKTMTLQHGKSPEDLTGFSLINILSLKLNFQIQAHFNNSELLYMSIEKSHLPPISAVSRLLKQLCKQHNGMWFIRQQLSDHELNLSCLCTHRRSVSSHISSLMGIVTSQYALLNKAKTWTRACKPGFSNCYVSEVCVNTSDLIVTIVWLLPVIRFSWQRERTQWEKHECLQ